MINALSHINVRTDSVNARSNNKLSILCDLTSHAITKTVLFSHCYANFFNIPFPSFVEGDCPPLFLPLVGPLEDPRLGEAW